MSQHWLPGLAIIKLAAGVMTCIILGLSIRGTPKPGSSSRVITLRDQIFKGLVGLIVMITVYSIAPKLSLLVKGLPESLMISSVMLLVFGILQLSMSSMALKIIVGLLTAISGFEILFSTLENSLLLTGLIAGVHLSLGMLGSYLVLRSESGEMA